MASKSAQFFENGTNKQFEFVLSKYQESLQAKADSKNSKSEILLKLDKWYQNELPKKIKSRGKEAHLTHEEIVQTIKWKLARGQFRPRLKDLIQMNTPRVVMQETKKAFRAIFKKNDLEAAVNALSNLKGVGPAMASAVLAAGAPEVAPFMADELLLSMPEVEGIDYTMKEYMKLVEKTKECVDRLNAQGGSWNPHKVEMTVWAYYIARDLKPEILDDMPDSRGNTYGVTEPVKEVVEERVHGENGVNGEVSKENGDQKEERNQLVENQTNGVSEVDDSQKSVHSLSPEPEAEPIGFTSEEPVGFNPEPVGFNYNGVGSASENNEASNSSEPTEDMPTEDYAQPEDDERQMNGESTKEVPFLGNGSSYPAYNYNEPTQMYSAPPPMPTQDPAPVEHRPVVEHISAPVETPVYNKRPLEETEEATPESKRVREDSIPTPLTAESSSHPEPINHISEELPVGGVVPVVSAPPQVTECPAPNGVNSAPPQPIHTGGD
eukprot:TRINITY_DN1335_c0_g1_i1.p1 TRINITY_DN1335_c0_g1~~TRINITY_DN1335_c0_g1_i1.p1  ORF type:complete len:494 (+),score=166.78 TRINITY_DN1335_c0_g1_i1:156-1637(+)